LCAWQASCSESKLSPLVTAERAAEKKGEAVEPAGGETGEPRCLAEVYKAAREQLSIN